METLGCDDQHFGHLPFLFLPFFGIGVSITDTYLPLHAQFCDHFFHRSSNILCEGPQWRDPDQSQAIFISGTVVRWVFMDELNDCAQENRKGFSTTCWRIHQTTLACIYGLPGLFLKSKRLHTPALHPFLNDRVADTVMLGFCQWRLKGFQVFNN